MNYFPLKEIVSNLQNPTDEDGENNLNPRRFMFPKKAFILSSIGLLSLILSLSIALGINVSSNNHLKSQTEHLQKFENLTKFMSTISDVHQQLLNTAVLEDEFDLMELLLQNQPANKTIAQNHTDEALFLAVEQNKFQFVKTLINYGANVTARDGYSTTSIHFAESKEMVDFLLEHGADSNAVNHQGYSLLHDSKDAEMMKVLIQNGGNVSIKTKSEKRTPLMLAAWSGRPEVVKVLLENGASMNEMDISSRTPLHFASGGSFGPNRDKDKANVAKMLINHGADINAGNNISGTPLYYASRDGNIEVTKVLIENGANVNAKLKTLETPLHYAKNGEMARLLIKNGANVTARNAASSTPLHFTEDVGVVKVLIDNGVDVDIKKTNNNTRLCMTDFKKPAEVEMAKFLLENGANPNSECRFGPPLAFAILRSSKMIELLLKHNASVDFVNRSNETILQNAAYFGKLEAVKLLIKYGANVTFVSNGSLLTPLHNVAKDDFDPENDGSHGKIAEILIQNGAIVDAKDKDAKTPLHYAAQNGEIGLEIAKVLLDHGAKTNAKSKDGKTPLDLAKEFKNEKIVEFLTNFTNRT